MNDRKQSFRAVLAALAVLSLLGLGLSYATAERPLVDQIRTDDGWQHDPSRIASADSVTVVGTDSNSWRGRPGEVDTPRGRAELVAVDGAGTVLYYNDSRDVYWDVDPVPGTEATVEAAFADHLDAEACPSDWNHSQYAVDETTWERYYEVHGESGRCTRNGVDRVNLTTGETTTVWTAMTPGQELTRFHDVDRVNETHLAVADIYLDRLFVVEQSNNEIVWTWNASDEFSTDETGGPYPKDWSHINDVELVDDGERLMVSMRNHDRVVFVDRRSGEVDDSWTLGAEDDYGVLYEQHNPDYIPESQGGPAVLVADSENNRVVEYQRENGTWVQTWQWRDARMQWPRDADRLPNGNTLITDSNGNRVFEVDRAGEIVWSVTVGFPYEAERLDTGDESAGGTTAQSLGLDSRAGDERNPVGVLVKDALPNKYLNGVLYATPIWMSLAQVALSLLAGLSVALWVSLEVFWRVRG
ncbi:arylsulfotransferase family protein [Haloprofundus salinisoli]|uniref:arylsulfotransferase family protein n=1 Tax=Haloprofundus salinisoli TaxID=2876193 RepID=UPI001CCC9238|nr:arylsulfotransferase family protein [Haloprofundus salinisoli]